MDGSALSHPARVAPPSRWPLVLAGVVAAVLIAVASRYGYHRDELYFLAAGRHLAWGYPDQPPLVPALARLMSTIAPESLTALRVPSALAAAGVVVATGLTARELGAGRSGQTFAAGCMAVASLLLGAAHLLSTTALLMLAVAVLLWLATRLLRTGDERLWLGAGVVTGAGLLANDLMVAVAGAVIVGVLVAGPRRLLRSPWLVAGAVVAIALWSPYLAWQGGHGWPQLGVARSIASGGSGSSASRWLLLPFQLALVSPPLAPVWIVGVVRLLRDPSLRWCRALGVVWPLLAVAFLVAGGKPYYLGVVFPLLIAAGAQPTVRWAWRGRARVRQWLLGAAFVTSAMATVIVLPLVPVTDLHKTPIVAMNYDAGETVGWPAFVGEIAAVYRTQPPGTVVLASNYGEAGAIDRYGMPVGLPSAYSGHMAFWLWGPPPADTTRVVAIGFDRDELSSRFTDVRAAGRLDNHVDLDDDEQGEQIWLCSGPRAPWPALWAGLRNYG